ncbi:hypothetical protein [Mucilaginibacter sp.]|uniref:hypothetical protein n=1 Tax=Mucilaginibacter sp. TaxID=1882438 RepID=UPI003D0AAFE5
MFFKILKMIFSRKRTWNGSPEMFLAMMLEMEAKGRENDASSASAEQLAGVMMKICNINLYPYKDFSDLQNNGTPDYSLIEKVRPKLNDQLQRMELKKAIYGNNADLGEDDPLAGNSDAAKFTRSFIEDFQQYVELKDENVETPKRSPKNTL